MKWLARWTEMDPELGSGKTVIEEYKLKKKH
mgnify:CR=1 FL=1